MNLVFKLDVELVSQLKLAKDPIKDKRYVKIRPEIALIID